MGLCANDTYEELCGKLLECGLDDEQLEDIKALVEEYADETLAETVAEEFK
jgi:phosphoribosylformylglycinamidine (FGAM) synthase PurS component